MSARRRYRAASRSRSASPSDARGDGAAYYSRRLGGGDEPTTLRVRQVLIGLAAALLAFAGVGRYPLAAFPYLYTALLQHALRGNVDWGVWVWLAVSTYLALCFGLLEFLPVADLGYLIVTAFLAVFPPLAFVFESRLSAALFPPTAAHGAVPLRSTLLMPVVTCAVDYVWAHLVLYGSYGLWPYTQCKKWHFLDLRAVRLANPKSITISDGLLPVMQIAAVFGIYGISFFVAWSASLAAWLLGTNQTAAEYRRGLVTLLALWGGVLLLGGARLTLLQPADTVPTVRVHAISTPNNTVVRNDLIRFHLGPTLARQELYGGFSDWQETNGTEKERAPALWDYAKADVEWSLRAIYQSARSGGADIILLPELGLTLPNAEEEAALVKEAQQIADDEGVVIALGLGVNRLLSDVPLHSALGLLLELPGPPYQIRGAEENKMHVILPKDDDPAAAKSWQYWKRNTVPVIERPFTNVESVYGFSGNATPEVHRSTVATPGRPTLGCAICFDMEHPTFIRQLAAADILLNPSYDWPGLNPLHAHVAAFRAIETGTSVVHHCMGGTSMAYDYRGVALAHNDHFAMAAHRCGAGASPRCSQAPSAPAAGVYMAANVPTSGVATLYANLFGDALPLTCVAVVLVLAVANVGGELAAVRSAGDVFRRMAHAVTRGRGRR